MLNTTTSKYEQFASLLSSLSTGREVLGKTVGQELPSAKLGYDCIRMFHVQSFLYGLSIIFSDSGWGLESKTDFKGIEIGVIGSQFLLLPPLPYLQSP